MPKEVNLEARACRVWSGSTVSRRVSRPLINTRSESISWSQATTATIWGPQLNKQGARPYNGALRIPLVFRGPGVPKAVSDELVEIVDELPTLLEMPGVPLPSGNQGISLVPAMARGNGRNLIYRQAFDNRMIRTKHAKYWIGGRGEEVLFDYSSDPHKLRNEAQDATQEALRDAMRVALLKKVIAARDPLPERILPH